MPLLSPAMLQGKSAGDADLKSVPSAMAVFRATRESRIGICDLAACRAPAKRLWECSHDAQTRQGLRGAGLVDPFAKRGKNCGNSELALTDPPSSWTAAASTSKRKNRSPLAAATYCTHRGGGTASGLRWMRKKYGWPTGYRESKAVARRTPNYIPGVPTLVIPLQRRQFQIHLHISSNLN